MLTETQWIRMQTAIFKKLYGKTVVMRVEMEPMYDSQDVMERVYRILLRQYGAKADKIKQFRVDRKDMTRERCALIEFVGMVRQFNWNMGTAAEITGMDRTCLIRLLK